MWQNLGELVPMNGLIESLKFCYLQNDFKSMKSNVLERLQMKNV